MTMAEAYSVMTQGNLHPLRWPAYKRHDNLPWHHPYYLPFFPGDETKYCRDNLCPLTHWGGYNRLHARGTECPPYRYQGRHRSNR